MQSSSEEIGLLKLSLALTAVLLIYDEAQQVVQR